MKEAYCAWNEKRMRDLTEHEQEQCEKYGWTCIDCPYLTEKEKITEQEGEKRV